MDVDIVIDEAPDTVTLQSEQWLQLTELAKNGIPIKPETLIKASSLRNKDELIDDIETQQKQGGGVPPQVAEEIQKIGTELQKKGEELAQQEQEIQAEKQSVEKVKAEVQLALANLKVQEANLNATAAQFKAEVAEAQAELAQREMSLESQGKDVQHAGEKLQSQAEQAGQASGVQIVQDALQTVGEQIKSLEKVLQSQQQQQPIVIPVGGGQRKISMRKTQNGYEADVHES
jgi:predicted ribosome quality control (RQC) complex YloA/Tae2 family protein